MSTVQEDVHRLGALLGSVLREQAGEPFFELVEEVRKRTKAMREAGEDTTPLQELARGVTPDRAEGLVRAFSLYFQLVNMAEEHERVGRLAQGDAPRAESFDAAFELLRERGLDAASAAELVRSVRLGLTFTAHPTEMRRRTLRQHLSAIAEEIPTLGEAASTERVLAHVEALWGTLELRHSQPTVHDEVRGGLAYVPVIASVLPELELELRRAFRRVYGVQAALELPLGFHSWIGGDRDGNPFVTPEVTRETFAFHAENARSALRDAIASSYASLSQDRSRVVVPAVLEGGEEPWRTELRAVHDALEAHASIDLAGTLSAIERTLREAAQERSADAFALPLCVRERAFGAHFVSLDVREHSAKTGAAVAELLRCAHIDDYAGRSEAEKRRILLAELATRRPLLAVGERPSPEVESVLGPLVAVRDAIANAGPRAFGRYVTSMSEDASDLLEVLVLAREAGVRALPVPLFETRDDLARAPRVMADVLAIPAYRAYLGDDVQEVMIGYSDSNKDAGFFAAYWALHEAQLRVADACRDAGVRFQFFHGRGTSIGRGGGPMVRGILGQPAGTIGAGLRITEQGEALADKYGRPESARRNLEQGVFGLLAAASSERTSLPDAWARALDRAADESVQAYRSLVTDPGFLSFFEAVTPINEIAQLRIASRPVRRPGKPTLANLRAIPWVMSWTQCRANLPGWYGLEVALRSLGTELSRELYADVPFFRSMMDNAQLGLAMSDATIFRAYLTLVPDDRIGLQILAARDEAIARIEAITGDRLLGGEPRTLRSIALRSPYLEPIHRIQVELLRRVRSSSADARDPVIERALLLSIHGIAAGVRSAG